MNVPLPPASDSENPFDSETARENSCYTAYDGEELVNLAEGEDASAQAKFVHTQLRSLVLSEQFSCIGAKAAFNQNVYRFGFYRGMADSDTVRGLARDLHTFVNEREEMSSSFTSFIASFATPIPTSEQDFEKLVWRTLQELHLVDAEHNDWDPEVDRDPESPMFSFSVSETAFFIVGLHPGSSRIIRRFSYPTLVFNAHEQFEQLRESGRFEAFKKTIRKRERELQGSINPNLSDFGEETEAIQYSGRPVEEGWAPPFNPVEKNTE